MGVKSVDGKTPESISACAGNAVGENKAVERYVDVDAMETPLKISVLQSAGVTHDDDDDGVGARDALREHDEAHKRACFDHENIGGASATHDDDDNNNNGDALSDESPPPEIW